MTKKILIKLRSNLKDYFIGMFLVPWVWIWGFFIIFFCTYLLGFYRGLFTGLENFRLSSDFINLVVVWITVFIGLLGNYSIYHYTRYTHPRLKPVLFIISFFTFTIFTFIYFPFLLLVIKLD